MCGIAGIFSVTKQSPEYWYEWGKSFSKSLANRGPDDEGFLLVPDEGLPLPAKTASKFYRESAPYIPQIDFISVQEESIMGLIIHRRLSILGLSELGHQPMCDEEGRFWISFNGEIYNYKELAQTYGFTQQSQTDTEILLQLWKLKGAACLEELDGFFALCIYDARKKEVILARDRTGVKPLYFGHRNGVFGFCSTESALAHLFDSTSISESAVFHHLRYGMTDAVDWFDGVHSLKAGEIAIWNIKHQDWVRKNWYSFRMSKSSSDMDLFSVLEKSMHKRLRSDVPVGFAVSGGLDSAILVGLARRILGKEANLKSFSITSKGQDSDESSWQRMVNQFNDMEEYSVDTSEFSWQLLPEMIYSVGRPAVAWNNIGHYALCKEVKKQGVTVLFNGQGADELFGGYPDYYIEDFGFLKGYLWKMRHHLPLPWMMLGAIHTKRNWSRNRNLESQLKLEKKKWGHVFQNDLFEGSHFQLNPAVDSVEERMLGDYFGNQYDEKFYGRLQQMLAWDDRNGMAFQLESRNPFSDDNSISNFVQGKFNLKTLSAGGYPKGLLRQAVKDVVPQVLLERTDKKGFSVPDTLLTKSHGLNWKEACMSSLLDKWIHRNYREHLVNHFEHLSPRELAMYFKICSLGYFVQAQWLDHE